MVETYKKCKTYNSQAIARDLLRDSKVNTTWNLYTQVDTKDQRKVLDEIYKPEEVSDLEIDLSEFQFELK